MRIETIIYIILIFYTKAYKYLLCNEELEKNHSKYVLFLIDKHVINKLHTGQWYRKINLIVHKN